MDRKLVSGLAAAFWVAVGVALTPSATEASCGGKGERACCCFGDGRCCSPSPFCGAWDPACDSGLKEITLPVCGAGVAPDNCGGCSSSWCAEATTCGGDGQRACCSSATLPNNKSCRDGLIEDFTDEGSCPNKLGAENCACETGTFLSSGTCRTKIGVGETCNIATPCEEGLICRSVSATKKKCFADLDDAPTAEACLSLFSRGVLDTAVSAMPANGDRGESMFFGFGSAGGFIAQSSNVRGVVYGRDGCYGCYHTQCDGFEFSAGFSGVIEQARSSEHLQCPGPTVCDNNRTMACTSDDDCTDDAFCAEFACTTAPNLPCSMDSQCPGGGTCRRCNSVSGQSLTEIISAGTGFEIVGVSETLSFANCGSSLLFPEPECELVGTGESIAIGFTLSPPLNIGFAECTTITSVVGCLDTSGNFIEDVSNQPPTCSFTASPTLTATCSTQTSPSFTLTSTSIDPDGDTLSYQWTSNCAGRSFTAATSPTTNMTVGWPMCANCTVRLRISDGANSVICSPKTVDYIDGANPTAACKSATVALAFNTGSGSIVAADVNNGSSDACGAVTLAVDQTAFTCADVGGNTVTLTVTDACQNKDTCTATVTVNDDVDPVALCQNVTVELDAAGNASIVEGNVDNGSNDVCGISTLSLDTTAFDCADVGANTVTLTVTDVNGNSSTCDATVTVNDNVDPVALCQNVTVELDGSGNGSIVPADVDNGSSDACGIDTLSLDTTAFDCADVGSNTVTLTVTDVNGNSSTCDATITVEDNEDPVITCPSDIFVESAAGQCEIVVNYDVGISDNCPGTTFVCTHPSGSLFPVGTTAVTCTATDASGNQSDCSFSVTVNDPPQIVSVILATQTVQYSDKIVPVVVTATDCGPGRSLTLEFDSADVPNALALSSMADACGVNGAGLLECTWTLSNNDRVLEPEGDFLIDGIKAVDPTPLNGVTLKSSPAETITVQVKAENATIAFDGGNPVAVQVPTDGGNSGSFSLSVDVQELNPELLTAGGNLPGDIGLAVMSMTLAPVGPGGPAVGNCNPDNDPNPLDYTGVLTVTCAFDNVGVNTYTVEAVLVANGAGELFYTGSNEDVLVVFDPSLGFTTGGGWFHWPGSEDPSIEYPGDRTNWGYTMKYNKKRTRIQGSLLLIRHLPDGSSYRIKSNALFGLAIGDGTNDGPFGWASFAGKCTYRDPSMVEPVGNHQFVTYVEDHGEPGVDVDRFWLQVFDRDDDLIADLSMGETAVANAETIVGGNIVVPHLSRGTR